MLHLDCASFAPSHLGDAMRLYSIGKIVCRDQRSLRLYRAAGSCRLPARAQLVPARAGWNYHYGRPTKPKARAAPPMKAAVAGVAGEGAADEGGWRCVAGSADEGAGRCFAGFADEGAADEGGGDASRG
jgi:hypothetical protein